MQGPRQIPPGRKSYHRPPPGVGSKRRDATDRDRPPRRDRRDDRRPERPVRREEPVVGPPPIPDPPTHWLYLHGFASSQTSRKAGFFRQRFALVGLPLTVPDLNVPSFEHLTVSAQLEAIDAVFSNIPDDATVGVIGSSLGGLLAVLTAGRHRNVTRLVLMAPAFGLFRSNFAGFGRSGLRKWERDGWVEVHHYGEQRKRRVAYDFVTDALQYDEERVSITIPVTVVHGTNDDVVDPRVSIAYARTRPNVKLYLVDDDHSLLTSCTRIWDLLWKEIRPTPGASNRAATGPAQDS